MDECIAVLAKNKERPSDAILIHLVKLQLIVENVGQASRHEGYDDATASTRAPPAFYLMALRAQLQDLKAKISPEIQGNGGKTA